MKVNDRDILVWGIFSVLLAMFVDLLFFKVAPPPGDILLPYKTYSESFFWVTKTSQLKGFDLILGAKLWTALLINLSFPVIAWIIQERRTELLTGTQIEIVFLVLMVGVLGLFALKQAPYREGSLLDPFLILYLIPTFALFELAVRLKLRFGLHFVLQLLLTFYSLWLAFFVLVGD